MEKVNLLLSIPNRTSEYTEEELISLMINTLQDLIKIGALKGNLDDLIEDYQISEKSKYIRVTISDKNLLFTDKLNSLGASVVGSGEFLGDGFKLPEDYLKNIKISDEGVKLFSATTINERLRLSKLGGRQRFRYIINDYKKFWRSKKNTILGDSLLEIKLKNLFLTDVMQMFTEVLPLIEDGKQFSTLLGLTTLSPELGKVSRQLSITYKRVLKSEKTTGQINKTMYQRLKSEYKTLMLILMKVVFPELMEGAEIKVDETPDEDGMILNQQVNESMVSEVSKDVKRKFSIKTK